MKIRLIIAFTIAFSNLFAQNDATISGRIFEKDTGEPLSYATIVLHAADNQTMITGALSDETGRFTLEGIKKGRYQVVCSFVGYETINTPILIGEKNSNYDLGKIELPLESTQLDEVVVNAQKAVVGANLDKTCSW